MVEEVSYLESLCVSAAALGFITIYGFEMIFRRDDWPFSAYAMFSDLRSDKLELHQLYGVVKDKNGKEQEILLVDEAYLYPFDRNRLRRVFPILNRRRNAKELFNKVLKDCYERYESRRQLGRHDGPVLQGLRVYHEEWRLVPYAANREQPGKRTLFVEFSKETNGLR